MRTLLVDTGRSIVAHRVRFGLTALGIAWGALMLTFLSSSMLGLETHFVREIEEIGPRIVTMGRGVILKDRGGERGARRIELKDEHVERIEAIPAIEHASPEIVVQAVPIRAGRRSKLLNLTGLDADGDRIHNVRIARGRYFTPTDVARTARVAVLGHDAATRLFGRSDPIGRHVLVDGYRLRVVGIAVAKGSQLMNSGNPDDLKIFLPSTTVERLLTRTDALDEFVFAPRTKEESWHAIERVREVTALREGYDPRIDSAMWAFNIQEPLTMIRTLFLGMRVFMIGAGLVTLFVGAVGVMNIMLVVVGERRQEIGIRKAIGARSADVFVQFLAEATLVAMTSGVAGAAVGIGLVRALSTAMPEGSAWQSPPVLDPVTVVVFTGALIVVAVVSGLVPAIRAAQVPPAEALRTL